MEKKEGLNLNELVSKVSEFLMENYWGKMWKVIEENPQLKTTFPAFLLNPEKLIFYFGKKHWAIEYVGGVKKEELNPRLSIEVEVKDYTNSENLFNEILGISYSKQTGPEMPLAPYNEDLFYPTDEALDIMQKNGWNFGAQSMIFAFNSGGLTVPKDSYSRVINSFFYDVDDQGLITRHIKWLDIFPLEINDVNKEVEEFNLRMWPNIEQKFAEDALFEYPMPKGYQYEKLPQLNRFIEMISSRTTTEPEITKFLAMEENQFILKMAFMGMKVDEERECEWQSDAEKKSIKPDFFLTSPNSFADIVEFKLPYLKGNPAVGRDNRETFSAEVQSYISQTRVYEEYFEDPNNRKYVEEKYNLKVHYPKRVLVIGRRWMWDSFEWRKLENDFSNITIRTYDDIIDGVLSHLYL